MEVGVADDADAGAARAERDEPHPVAASHQVVGAVPSLARRDACFPRRIAAPVVDVDAALDPPPAGVRAVRARARQSQLPPDDAGAAARIGDPPGSHRSSCARRLELDLMECLAERDAADGARIVHLDALLAQRRQQIVLEAPAIELERGHGRVFRRPELDAARDVAVALVREEVAEAELLELLAPQVRLEAEHAPRSSGRRSRRWTRRP